MSASGQQTYSDGSVYDGTWNSEGQKHGRGKLVYHNRTEYNGQFERGLHSGPGILVIPDSTNKYIVVASFTV